MDTFFKVVLIIILVYYGLKLLGRYVFPFLLAFLMKKLMSKLMNGQGSFGGQPQQPQDDITEKTSKKQSKRFTKDTGEYIDFEEVK